MSKTENGEYREISRNEAVVWNDRKHWLWFPFSFTKYSVQNGRLYVNSGFLASREDECLLYRITDITLTRSIGQRLCGTGTIQLNTKDRSTPIIYLRNIRRPVEIKRMLSNMIEDEREKHNIVGRDMYGASSHIDPMEFDPDMDGDMGGHHGF